MMTAQLTAEHMASVVVIDDTPDLRLLLRMILELSDRYQVVGEAGDGATGIEVVREWQPDVVLLDLAMPIMDGLEALPSILHACPSAAVVVLSGFEADRMAHQAIELGAVAYVQKGSRPDEIVDAIDGVLDRSVEVHAAPELHEVSAPPEQSELDQLRRAVATAAHELRTPATVLIGLAKTLTLKRAALDQTRIDELLDALIRQTRVLDRVTADLLAATQADRGTINVQTDVFDVVPALHAAALAVAELTDVAIHSPETLLVRADPVRVQQMLTNLLSNALKYAAPPVSLHATIAANQCVVRVDDSGDGVPEPFRPQLFEQYSRAEQSRAPGSGLGLYVVRVLAEAQGGRAWYEPRPGIGSSFSFTLSLD
jgi:signal transduction histidine kinase